jgi:polysaccharide biosynthesis protein PslG
LVRVLLRVLPTLMLPLVAACGSSVLSGHGDGGPGARPDGSIASEGGPAPEDGSSPQDGSGPRDGGGPQDGDGPQDGNGSQDGSGPQDGGTSVTIRPGAKGMNGTLEEFGLSDQELAAHLDDMHDLGVEWIRCPMTWDEIQPDSRDSFSFARVDRYVAAAQSRGMQVLGILAFTPEWARPGGTDMFYGPTDPTDFASYAGATAAHFAPLGVHAWEVWNEPNIQVFWTPAPSPTAYTQLLRASYQAIKQADPSSVVVSAGVAPAGTDGTNYSPVDFIQAMYDAGGGAYLDAVGHHPYTFPDLPSVNGYWWQAMYTGDPNIRGIMTAHGDANKRIWMTEFGAPSAGGDGVGTDGQAAQVQDGYATAASETWAGPLFYYQHRDWCNTASDSECFFGLVAYDGSHKPAWATYQAVP